VYPDAHGEGFVRESPAPISLVGCVDEVEGPFVLVVNQVGTVPMIQALLPVLCFRGEAKAADGGVAQVPGGSATGINGAICRTRILPDQTKTESCHSVRA